jgi:hypothetical protein
MFVQHSVHIDRPIDVVSSALARGPREWLPRLEGPDHAAVGPRVAGVGILKKVAVQVGIPVTAGTWAEVSITWQATYIQKLFPVMTGKVELAPVDGHVTRLTVCGMYQPPLGALGKKIDDVLMHRVADATVKELAESIAKRLEAVTAEPLRGPG